MRSSLRDYLLLTRIQLLELRTWGPITVIFTTLFPLAMVFGFGLIGGGVSKEGFVYVVTGAAVISLVTIGVTATSQELGEMRKTGVFQYYASLPISKGALLTAILTVRVLTALPGLALTLVVGAWLYDVTLAVNAATLLLLPLTVVALSGIGAALGILVSDFRVVAAVSQLVFVVIMFASPVLIPPESLPPVLRWLSWVLPPTYAADGFRRALTSVIDTRLYIDLGVLAFCATVSLVAVSKGLRWRVS